MKKQLIVLAAAALLVGQSANAAVSSNKDGKPAGARAADVHRDRDAAAKAATGGASAKATGSIEALKSANLLPRLSPDKLASFEQALTKNADLAAAAKDVLAQSKNADFNDLAQARTEGLINIQNLDTGKTADAVATLSKDARNEQAYLALVLRAGKSATTWDAATRENMTFLIKETNNGIASGKSISDSIADANKALAASKKVSLNLDDVFKLCK